MSWANEHDVKVVEDNAQAHGAVWKGQKTGSFGHINAHSFYPGKNLGALGDGGMITTNDDDLAARARILRNYGSSVKYHNPVKGRNSRLDELQASFLLRKMKFIENWNQERELIARKYHERLKEVKEIRLLSLAESGAERVSYFSNVL